MIPGLYAYETILSIVKYSQASTIIAKQEILINIFDNGITALFIIIDVIVTSGIIIKQTNESL